MDLSENNGKRIDETFNSENVEKIKEKAKEEKGTMPKQVSGAEIPERVQEKKREAVLNLVQDVTAQREDIDKLNTSVRYIADKLTEMATVIDNQTKVLNQISQGAQTSTKNQFSELLNSDLGSKLIDKLLPSDKTSETPLISQEDIKNEMVTSFMDNLNTGKAINNFVKDALKKKVTRTVVNDTLSELGKTDIHGPA